jgi:hypothetical protein
MKRKKDNSRSWATKHLRWGAKISREEAARLQLHEIERIDDLGARIGQAGINLLVLINGGAAAVALAFVGALAQKSSDVALSKIVVVASTLEWFAAGVGLAGVAFATGHIACYFIVLGLNSLAVIDHEPWIVETDRARRQFMISMVAHGVGVILGLMSLGSFISGVFYLRAAVIALAVS